MDEYLIKPIQFAELAACLTNRLPCKDVAQAAGTPPDSPLDPTALDNLRMGLSAVPGGVAQVVASYLEGAPKMMDELRAAIAAGDPQRVSGTAHDLKSNSAALGALALAEMYRELESRGREGALEGSDRRLDAVEKELERVFRALGGLQADLAAPDARTVTLP